MLKGFMSRTIILRIARWPPFAQASSVSYWTLDGLHPLDGVGLSPDPDSEAKGFVFENTLLFLGWGFLYEFRRNFSLLALEERLNTVLLPCSIWFDDSSSSSFIFCFSALLFSIFSRTSKWFLLKWSIMLHKTKLPWLALADPHVMWTLHSEHWTSDPFLCSSNSWKYFQTFPFGLTSCLLMNYPIGVEVTFKTWLVC